MPYPHPRCHNAFEKFKVSLILLVFIGVHLLRLPIRLIGTQASSAGLQEMALEGFGGRGSVHDLHGGAKQNYALGGECPHRHLPCSNGGLDGWTDG